NTCIFIARRYQSDRKTIVPIASSSLQGAAETFVGPANGEVLVNYSFATADQVSALQTIDAVSDLAEGSSRSASRDRHFASLMASAQDGDRAAYAELLTQVAPLLRRWIQSRRRFIQAADIEDLVQDTLLSVHAARATYDPGRPFLPWLMTIAHNRMV